jgi:hypothetical protein
MLVVSTQGSETVRDNIACIFGSKQVSLTSCNVFLVMVIYVYFPGSNTICSLTHP